LAELLHKTVAQVEHEMSVQELEGWRMYLKEKHSGKK